MSCPIVPWTEDKVSALRSEIFVCLLQQLGLLPSVFRDPRFYPCIPYNWSPITVFRKALIFSPIEQNMVDFDLSLVINTTEQSNPCPTWCYLQYVPNWSKNFALRRKLLLITCNNIPIDDIFAKEAKLSGDYMVVDIVVLFPSDYIAGNRVLRILISSSYNLMRVKILSCICNCVMAVIALPYGRNDYKLPINVLCIVMPLPIHLLFDHLRQLPNSRNINTGKIVNGASKSAKSTCNNLFSGLIRIQLCTPRSIILTLQRCNILCNFM